MMIRETIDSPFFNALVKVFGCIAIFLITSISAFAQLERFPTLRTEKKEVSLKPFSAARAKVDAPLSIPFFDDFSKTTDGLFPSEALWDSSASVWINDAMGINPPTQNVATFDGLDSAGLAYNPTQVLQNGFTDSLTSKRIDLSETGLPLGERFSLFLSFFFQWQGNGEPPDPSDYLQLQFRDNQKNWVTVMTIKTKDSFVRTEFRDTIIQINEEKYFHDSFQFRFRSFGRESGPFDTWNIDYVYLNSNRTINDLSFPDQAASSTLGSLFPNGFRAMPYDHFRLTPAFVAPKFTLSNLKNFPEPVNYVTEGFFTNYTNGTSPAPYHDPNLNPANVAIGINDDGSNIIAANSTSTVTLKFLPDANDANQFDPNADSVKIQLAVDLDTGDNIQPDYTPNYVPIEFRTNDTIYSTYILKDYYAYDDGHAEYAAGLVQAGNLVAYEFELQGVNQDTLVGFDIYLPSYGVSSNQTVEFFIYGDHLLDPKQTGQADDILLAIPPKVTQRKGIDQFQRITFLPALLIPTKKFYIGWREPAIGDVLVGLDANNDTGNKIYVNTNGSWYQNNRVKGSLMVRPIFGKGDVDPEVGIEDEAFGFAVYPNPSNGIFYIDGNVDRVEVLSVTGKQIPIETEKLENRLMVSVNQPAGLYILRTFKGRSSSTRKIVIR